MVKYIYSMLNLVVLCFLGIWKSNNVTNSQLVQVTLYPHKKGKSIHSLHFLAHKTIYHRGKVERSGYHYASMFWQPSHMQCHICLYKTCYWQQHSNTLGQMFLFGKKNHQLDGSRFIKKRQVYQHPKPDFRTKYSTGCNFSKKGSISNLATF